MITLDEAYKIIAKLNEEAYDKTWDQWVDAGDDEDAREDASEAQREHFVELFGELDTNIIEDILHYRETNVDFKEDFDCWYGDDDGDDEDGEENPFNIVYYKMDGEGLDYCFRSYSTWDEIKDAEFHRLRELYVKAAEELEQYVMENMSDEDY